MTEPIRSDRRVPMRGTIAAACAALILAACSGDLTEAVAPSTSDKALFTDEAQTLDGGGAENEVETLRRDAARFLNQATFGADVPSTREVRRDGPRAWLDRQMTMPIGQKHLERLLAYEGPTLPADADLFGTMDNQEIMVNLTWQAWIEAPDQLRKRVAAALLEIFVITARVDTVGIRNNQRTAASFLDLLERHAFGNYRDLLYDVSRHPAMGHYLSFVDNQKAEYGPDGVEIRVPDENYAREILQLFSIGLVELNADGTPRLGANGRPIDTYTQDDIFNLARVFTGWQRDQSQGGVASFTLPMVADASLHSPEPKRFLGLTIRAGAGPQRSLERAIDHIAAHPNVGPFIGRQLIQRLVTSNPSPDYVRRVSAVFDNDGSGQRGNLGAVIRAILLDPEASERNRLGERAAIHGKLREPMMRLTAVARLLDDHATTAHYPIANLMDTSHGLGQSPLKSPSVFNFFRPGYVPQGSELGELGYVAPEFQIVTGSVIPASINLLNEYIDQGGSRLMIRDWVRAEQITDNPKKLVRFLNVMLTGRTLPSDQVAAIEAVVERISADRPIERYKAALQMVTASPAFLIQR